MATLGDIITEGLELGGNPGLSTGDNRALRFLRFFFQHLFQSFDWEFLETEAVVTPDGGDFSVISATIPATYKAVRQLSIQGELYPLRQIPYEQIKILRSSQTSLSSGKPTHFAVRETSGARQILLYPKPNASYNYDLIYYYVPDTSVYAAGTPNPIPNSDHVISMAVAHFAQAYDKEQLQVLMDRLAQDVWAEYRRSHRDVGRADVEQLDFDPGTFKYLRGE